MGRRTGTSYHPKIFAMHLAQAQNEAKRERQWQIMKRKYMRAAYWLERLAIAMDNLRKIDQGWEAWFDDDTNVPILSTRRDHTLIIEARIKELSGSDIPLATCHAHRNVFIWTDDKGAFVFSKASETTIGKLPEKLHWLLFDNAEDARKFIDGLDIKHIDYGYVLDIMTMPADLAPVAQAILKVRGN